MRFLADECCDFATVRVLRANDHDVLAVSEFQNRSVDPEILGLALAENRILLTEDKDFGLLVFAGRMNSPGVILIRFPASARGSLGEAVLKLSASTLQNCPGPLSSCSRAWPESALGHPDMT